MRLLEQVYNPDILNCLANLSNDEVFTPPEVVNNMLDMLPQELFRSTETTFLDPACKTGVFLREIAKRLMTGLSLRIPDEAERRKHIFTKQLFGIAITEMTSLLSRRSLYCSKFANTFYSIAPFETIDGNIRFKNTDHYWDGNKCGFCGASKAQYDRDESLEQYAYEFIHTTKPEELFDMNFDVIISNPPYQMNTGGGQSQAMPMYHRFVQQAKKLNPRYISMIIPSRYFAGGIGLKEFRQEMLSDSRISSIVDYLQSDACFPGVVIAGGVNYFLWERDRTGLCNYTSIDQGEAETLERNLSEYPTFIRSNIGISIVNKVLGSGEKSVEHRMSALSPYGLNSYERGHQSRKNGDYVLISSGGTSYISPNEVTKGHNYLEKYNVVCSYATSGSAASADKQGKRKVIARLFILQPKEVCTFSYFIVGSFETLQEAENYQQYLSTKFSRFLLFLSLSSIHVSRDKFQFVPDQDFTTVWTDEKLYNKYKLTEKEKNTIESMIGPMD